MDKAYLVIGDIGAHNGSIQEVDLDTIWSNDEPGGWTYQQMTGAHGTVLLETADLGKAQSCLDDFLECDAVETGTYCYTHNRI